MAEPAPFKPSEVFLTVPPLVGTMLHSECEHAAALLVRGCQALGDSWQALTWEQVSRIIKADVDAKTEPVASLARNPFFNPDFGRLVQCGFATRTGAEPGSPIELTETGIAALKRWVR